MKNLHLIAIGCLAVVVGGCRSTSCRVRVPVATLSERQQPVEIETTRHGCLIFQVLSRHAPEQGTDAPFPDDLTLYIRRPDHSLFATHEFHSSYQRFRIEVVDLDRHDPPEIVLIRGTGRGTSARREDMDVLALTPEKLQLRISAPYSDFFGSGAQWRYRHEFVDAGEEDVTEIVLTLEHTALGEGGMEAPELIPRDIRRVLHVRTLVE